ncbi:nucleotidyltransferase domain-containing protein [archaeon]|nr:MAG: nucleotidyltransferase domain-containing protein [archaeon]
MPLENLESELEDVALVKKAAEPKKKLEDTELYRKVVVFANEARKHYGSIIKSVLIFGSAVRGDASKTSDIDVLVVLDDTATKTSEDLDKVNSHLFLIAHELKDMHIQTHTLTEFWEWIKMGSPELVNFLRFGLAIYDTGFIKPVQRMLQLGMIPPSDETISLKARSSELRYRKLKQDVKSMVFDLRYTAMDMIQAAVMYHYKTQPDYKTAVEYLQKFVDAKKLEVEWIAKYKELDKMWKDIDHKVVKDVDAQYLGKAMQLSKELIDRFKKLVPKDLVGEELPEE